MEIDAVASEFILDSYHIENYLLDPGSIRSALRTVLTGADPFNSDDDVLDALRDCARELVDSLVLERLQAEVNDEVISAIEIKGPPGTTAPAKDLLPSY